MGKTYHSAERDMAERVRQIEERVIQISKREQRKADNLTIPAQLWMESGLQEGGILIINPNGHIRTRLGDELRRRNYKVLAVGDGQQAHNALKKSSYSLMIVHWGIFQRSSDLVNLIHKAFPRTRIIITSPNFAWPNESTDAAQRGLDALAAGAYSYIPEQHIRRNILTCVETALSSKEKSCPVLTDGLACNLQCVI